jgi:hypothetical protein
MKLEVAPDTAAAIDAALMELEHAWRELDFGRLKALWDTAHAPVYQAEEALAPCLSWAELDDYWARTRAGIACMGMRIQRPIRLQAIDDGLVTAVYEMHWDAVVAGDARPMGGDNRVFNTFRRTPAGWRMTQYVEAPLAPILYLRKLYEYAADPAFRARVAGSDS